MINAREAYIRVIFGTAFGKYIDGLVRNAVKNKQLYFKLPLSTFPEDLNIDDVLAGLILLGYSFERVENENTDEGCIVVGFSFQTDVHGVGWSKK